MVLYHYKSYLVRPVCYAREEYHSYSKLYPDYEYSENKSTANILLLTMIFSPSQAAI